jgi:oxygen-independent coproporphyrinogen-3 oxidase
MTDSRSLYVHAPWCLSKCPYCDFNAYAVSSSSDKNGYITALIADFKRALRLFPQTIPPPSIYFGGGTPSLFTPQQWTPFFQAIECQWQDLYNSGCEITMEISPLVTRSFIEQMVDLGVNRFSVGLQSFDETTLKILGREHRSADSFKILDLMSRFSSIRWNVDIMYGLTHQSVQQVLSDLSIAADSGVTHLSWYELMIEPGTIFARTPQLKASEEQLMIFEESAESILAAFEHYEVSAYAKNQHYSKHNLGYWLYDDYVGIGAGAHSKITLKPAREYRFYKTRSPKDYIRSQRFIQDKTAQPLTDFLMSRLRLFRPIKRTELARFPRHQRLLLQNWLESQKNNCLWEQDLSEDFCLSLRGRSFISDIILDWMSFYETSCLSK